MCILHTHVMKIHILPDHFACFAYAFRVVAQARTSFPTWAGGCHGVAEICMPWIVVWKLVGPLLVFRCLFMRRKLRPPSARCMCYWCPPFPKESGFAGVNEKWMKCMVQWILSVVSFVLLRHQMCSLLWKLWKLILAQGGTHHGELCRQAFPGPDDNNTLWVPFLQA